MKVRHVLTLAGLAGLAACGGSSGSGFNPDINAFTGALTITSALPPGTTICLTTSTVTFTAGGVDVSQVTVSGGGCIAFTNADAAVHWPMSNPPTGCPELNAPAALSNGQTFTSAPLDGPKGCFWLDAQNPPASGGY